MKFLVSYDSLLIVFISTAVGDRAKDFFIGPAFASSFIKVDFLDF